MRPAQRVGLDLSRRMRLWRHDGRVARLERRAGALQRAAHRGHAHVQTLGRLGRRPVEDLCEQKYGALARRQVLQRRDEGEPDALAQDRVLLGVGLGRSRERCRIRDRLDPALARTLLEHEAVMDDGGVLGELHRPDALAVRRRKRIEADVVAMR